MKTYEIDAEVFWAGSTDGYKDTVDAYFETLSLAETYAKNKHGNYGRAGAQKIRHKYVVCASIEEAEIYKKEELAKYAKTKLTKEEFDALVFSIKKA